MTHSSIRRTFSVEHRYLDCKSPFDEVHQTLMASLPPLEQETWDILARGERDKVAARRQGGPKLWLFLIRDHGKLTAADGLRSKAMQYEIGNPLTAERMTRRQLAAGPYAPLRVYLYEDAPGRAVFEYDLPSSLFGQFGDDGVTAVGRELDLELEQALEAAAGYGASQT